MRIDSNPAKEERNRRKHKIGPALADVIFNNPHAITVYDRSEDGEDRWHAFGLVAGTLFLVVHTYPDPDDEMWIRVIGCEKRQRGNVGNMRKVRLTDGSTKAQLADVRVAQGVEPDTGDIPEAPAGNWAEARRLFRPRKEAISLRLDADVLDWLRRRHEHYQPEINRILRERMEAEGVR